MTTFTVELYILMDNNGSVGSTFTKTFTTDQQSLPTPNRPLKVLKLDHFPDISVRSLPPVQDLTIPANEQPPLVIETVPVSRPAQITKDDLIKALKQQGWTWKIPANAVGPSRG